MYIDINDIFYSGTALSCLLAIAMATVSPVIPLTARCACYSRIYIYIPFTFVVTIMPYIYTHQLWH